MNEHAREPPMAELQATERPLKDGRGQAPDASRAHRAFLAFMRHELRTPINAIIGYSEMLLEDATDRGQEDLTSDLQKIHTAGNQLLALVNDILDPMKIEAGMLDLDLETFGANLRHELLTPINAIIGYSEMLLEDATDRGQEDLTPDLQKIHAAAQRFLTLINDVVNFARMHEGELAFDQQASETSAMIQDVMSTIRPLGAEDSDALQAEGGSLLVVDDNEINRDVLSRHLARQGHTVAVAENGRRALELCTAQTFDLVLLDVMMPEMNGYQVLQHLKTDPALRDMPVIMISALDDLDSVVRCIEMGAEDYLPKPFNPVLLKARIGACLEKKRLRDREKAYVEQLRIEREKAERLLLNILPKAIADQLKEEEQVIAEHFESATVLFGDLVGFTELTVTITPAGLIHMLNEIFSSFDQLADRHGLEKIKTMGDCYMLVGGLPVPRPGHAEAVAAMAIEMLEEIERFNTEHSTSLSIRIGINTGPVVAGIIGRKKFIYDLWGDTVNTASRMESHGAPGRIHVTAKTYEQLRHTYRFEAQGTIEVKGKGAMFTYFLVGRNAGDSAADGAMERVGR